MRPSGPALPAGPQRAHGFKAGAYSYHRNRSLMCTETIALLLVCAIRPQDLQIIALRVLSLEILLQQINSGKHHNNFRDTLLPRSLLIRFLVLEANLATSTSSLVV